MAITLTGTPSIQAAMYRMRFLLRRVRASAGPSDARDGAEVGVCLQDCDAMAQATAT